MRVGDQEHTHTSIIAVRTGGGSREATRTVVSSRLVVEPNASREA